MKSRLNPNDSDNIESGVCVDEEVSLIPSAQHSSQQKAITADTAAAFLPDIKTACSKKNREYQARYSLGNSSMDYRALLYSMLILSVVECVLVGFTVHGTNILIGQIVILALSSSAVFADVVYVTNRMVSLQGQISSVQ